MNNVQTIETTPPEYLHPMAREILITRAAAGEDVYAYHNTSGWQLWDTDTRIPLAPLSQVQWQLLGATQQEPGARWHVAFTHRATNEMVSVPLFIYELPIDRDYPARVERVAQMIEGYIAIDRCHPSKFTDCHF